MFFCKGTNFEGVWYNPHTRFTYFFLRACSLVVERPAHNRVVVGSNPSGPILFTFLDEILNEPANRQESKPYLILSTTFADLSPTNRIQILFSPRIR